MLVADGVDGEALAKVQAELLAAGAVPRLVGIRIGPFKTGSGEVLDADASMENEPAVVFDALVLPDGAEGIEMLKKVGHTAEYIKDTYRHCKPIMVVGESGALLEGAGAFRILPNGEEDPGIVAAEAKTLKRDIGRFIAAIARHRHPERETDPPAV